MNFSEIRINIEETLEDVFSEDIADKLFNDAGEFYIVADSVDIQLGGAQGSNTTVTVSVKVYNKEDEEINIKTYPAVMQNGKNNQLEIKMEVGNADVEAMKGAKHLGFNFLLEGEDVNLNQSDYISINKLKFKTTNGIAWSL
ncbi:MAG: hypothetical protein LUE93_16530 [Bacteroides sp.]|nr:hypothetical protein [Bacteroides sp.]